MIRKFLQRISGTNNNPAEWRTDKSLFDFIATHITPDGRLDKAAYDLPDRKKEPDQIQFAPGLLDAMVSGNQSEESQALVEELMEHLKAIAISGDKTSEHAFYTLITAHEGINDVVDDLLEAAAESALPLDPYLVPFVLDLITRSGHRNAVKMGISIGGLCRDTSILSAIKILALHDEFTLYAAIALFNGSAAPVGDLWDLAKKVDGWGKIQLVSRLATLDLSEEIKDWLILEGYKNSIMIEYLAYTCATYGQLQEKLAASNIDDALFKASSEIIGAMIYGGPAEDISMYTDAPATVENYIRHAAEHADDITDFVDLEKLKQFLTRLTEDIGEHAKNGWTDDIISNCLIDLLKILHNDKWKRLAIEALASDNDGTYWHGKMAAASLGIDIWDTSWKRLQQQPLNSSCWYDVAHQAPADMTDTVIDFALTHLPLQACATGPKDAMGFGEHFDKYQSLEHVVTFLENHPQKGETIILAALDSPVTRNRNMAIRTLQQWTPEFWSAAILAKVKRLKEIEPNTNTRETLEKLLQEHQL
ncbi:hypothetical protein SAMN05428949_6858 [Chitinophaga sp. YR627]|uniref:hypothetical protein n=1 Tax=Chitinophaga sp. YR627 TaxID=1881041 RepID=UPI0008EA1CA6|nr:hypothetical protein [Chitinophaga sp. YR627]SFO88241.1 hypothetical protein SAMN05428949_6858 [Chitinophaga sp. YR627]